MGRIMARLLGIALCLTGCISEARVSVDQVDAIGARDNGLTCSRVTIGPLPNSIKSVAEVRLKGRSGENSTRLGYEEPPASLTYNIKFKKDAYELPRERAVIAMVRCVGELAKQGWDAAVIYAIQCNQKPQVSISMRPAMPVERVRNKHVIWTLREVFLWWVVDNEFGETSVFTSLDGSPLVFGTALIAGLVADFNGTTNASNVDVAATSADVTDLGATGVQVGTAFWDPPNPLVTMLSFYSLVLDLIVKLAESPAKDKFFCDEFYSATLDVSFVISATSQESAEDGKLTVDMVIQAMMMLSDFMIVQPHGQRYSTFTSVIKSGGEVVGQIGFHKGRDWAVPNNQATSVQSVAQPTVATSRRNKR